MRKRIQVISQIERRLIAVSFIENGEVDTKFLTPEEALELSRSLRKASALGSDRFARIGNGCVLIYKLVDGSLYYKNSLTTRLLGRFRNIEEAERHIATLSSISKVETDRKGRVIWRETG